ncbi:MAG: T9SS type A sorting domain-containing protein [Bacteroidota bacterium]|jgi:hypothetical protein
MKRILLNVFTFISFTFVSAQQPSFDFETWNPPPFGFPHPQGWTSANVLGSPLNDTVCHKAGSPNIHSGNFSMKLETVKLGFNFGTSAGVPDTVCFALTGNIVATPSLNIKPGFAFTGRPTAVNFYYKYAPSGIDSASAGVYLTKWNGTFRDTVAEGRIVMGSASTFTSDSIQLNYRSAYLTSGNPDTANIYFASSNIKSIALLTGGVLSVKYSSPKIGSVLWVDDILLTPVGIKENIENELLAFYPVPASDRFNVKFNEPKNRKISVLNSIGEVMETFNFDSKDLIINTSKYPSGIYYLSISLSPDKTYSKKFIVSH